MRYYVYFDKYEGSADISIRELASSNIDKMFCALTKARNMGEFVSLGSLVTKLLATPASKRKSIFTPRETTVKCGGFRSKEKETVGVETLPNGVIHLVWRRECFSTKNGKESSSSEMATLTISLTKPAFDVLVCIVDV